MEPYEKIYVQPDFLETEHGKIPCETCHGGDPKEPDWQKAHKGIVRDPTFPDPAESCGECHENTVSTAPKSLHFTLAPFRTVIETRATKKSDSLAKVLEAEQRHCGGCHASCGQCHVSRPNYVQGGFLAGHLFQKKPPMDTTCASCHGGRVHREFTGARDGYPADIHYADEEMTCMDCHTAEEMHADAKGAATRFDLSTRPRCEKCHPDAVSETPKTRSHALHKDKVACQVCHALASRHCFNCHVGTDKKGLPYFKCSKTVNLFKVGLNPNPGKDRPHAFVVLRHPPADPGLFDFYVKEGLGDFEKLATWKLSAPHTIQRTTPQNKACNNCHGNASLFLQQKDLADFEKEANARVIVPDARLPKPVEEVKK